MIIKKLGARIKILRPNCKCKIINDNYDTMQMLDGTEKPTVGEINSIDIDQIESDENDRVESIASYQEMGGLKKISVQQAEDIIGNKYDTVRKMPVSGESNAATIANIEAKINALIDACHWIDTKEAIYLLK